MFFLVLSALWKLIRFRSYIAPQQFSNLYQLVSNYPTARRVVPSQTAERLCRAMDLAASSVPRRRLAYFPATESELGW
jgi:hypothetical protein